MAEKEYYERTKPYVNAGIIGHADYGKTALTAAVVTVLAEDGLAQVEDYLQIDAVSEEEERGIIISTAHVEYKTKNCYYAHMDVLGHTDCIKNITTGAVQTGGAILVVAATDDPMPQTCEHILLIRQVDVKYTVIFLDKVDLVNDPRLIDLVEMEVRDLLIEYDYPGDDIPVIRGPALKALQDDSEQQDVIRKLMEATDEHIPALERDTDKPFLMSVENVFTITGHGAIASGRIDRGTIEAGDKVEIVDLTDKVEKSTVTGLEMFHKTLDLGEAGDNVDVLLRGIDRDQVERDQALAVPGSIQIHKKFKGQVCILNKDEGGHHTPSFSDYRLQFYPHTADVTGRIELPESTEMVMPGDNVEFTVELIKPITIEKGTKSTIREDGRTVGVGQVIEIPS